MNTVRELLNNKGYDVKTVGPRSTVYDAVKMMAEEDIGSVAVVDEGLLIGIFTERHYARRVFIKGKSSPETLVEDVMSRNPVCVTPDETVDECMALMTEKAFRHLPVLENDQMIGIISIGDLVKSKISDQEFIISQLEHYIHGT